MISKTKSDIDRKTISLGERLVTAALTGLIMAVMAICIPIALAILSRGRGLGVLTTFSTFHIWGSAVIGLAALTGFILGTDRTTALFGHLWGTEEPPNPLLTCALWVALAGCALISYYLFGKYHLL